MSLIEPLHGSGPGERWGYRDKVCLSTRWQDGQWQFGLIKRHELIAIPDCPVHSPRVRATIAILRAALPPGERFPMAFYVQSGAQTTLVLKSSRRPEVPLLDPERVRALQSQGIEGLWLNLHPAAGKRLFTKNGWHLLWGTERSRDRLDLIHGPSSFQQLRASLYSVALDEAERFLAPTPDLAVADLYCGTGASLLRWIRHGAQCAGVELSGEALECAQSNAPGAFLLRGKCAQRLPQLNAWIAATTCPPERRAVYVNPPRTGLEPEVLNWIADVCRPARLAYLSCGAGTLARDLARLATGGLKPVRIVPFDFFPQTRHVETLALLQGRRA